MVVARALEERDSAGVELCLESRALVLELRALVAGQLRKWATEPHLSALLQAALRGGLLVRLVLDREPYRVAIVRAGGLAVRLERVDQVVDVELASAPASAGKCARGRGSVDSDFDLDAPAGSEHPFRARHRTR